MLKRFLEWIGELSLFIGRTFRTAFSRPFEFQELVKQVYEIGNRSFGLVGAAGFAIGVVLAIQTRSTLARFGAEALLPSMISIAVVRELGPIITGLMVAGRVGAGLAAELGSMRVTEQIDALEVSANDPFRYLIVPRILACIIAMPILTIYCDFLSMIGGYFATSLILDTTAQLYFDASLSVLEFVDVFPSIAKTTVFGLFIGAIGCYTGYSTEGGTAGVGRSATVSVVLSSLMVIISDVIIVKIIQTLFET
jgi:phospholipid/cholesterol/gamma-HCH transport system permease protein